MRPSYRIMVKAARERAAQRSDVSVEEYRKASIVPLVVCMLLLVVLVVGSLF